MDQLTQEIVSNLNIEEVVRDFYPAHKITGTVNKGWLQVRAFDRDDGSPSAGINLQTGVYHDFGAKGKPALALFDWLTACGAYPDWREARQAMATRAGVKVPAGKKFKAEDKRWQDQVDYARLPIDQNPLGVRGLIARKPGITLDAIMAFGGRRCTWGKNFTDVYATQQKINDCVGFPILDINTGNPLLFPPCGITLYPADGRYIWVKSDAKGQINRGTAGVLNAHAMAILMNAEARAQIIYIFKVEGLTDALALFAKIPPELRDFYPVITNSSGAQEQVNLTRYAMLLKDLPAILIHDADKPGQTGAKHWERLVAPSCKSFRNVQLSKEIAEDHGLDLRDWLNDGHTFEELLGIIEATKPIETAGSEDVTKLSDDDRILYEYGLVVIGDVGDKQHSIEVFSRNRRDYFKIVPAAMNALLIAQITGRKLPPGVTAQPLKEALVNKAAERGRINDQRRIGPGVWMSRDKTEIAIVGEQGLFTYDGKGGLHLQESPFFDGRATLLRLPDFDQPWFDEGKLAGYVNLAYSNPEWARPVLGELDDLFRLWTNLSRLGDDATLLSGLVIATIFQDIWKLRPQVWISGPTDSGKSEMAGILEKMFGPLVGRMDAPTEAGFRNHIQLQKRFCIIDEFEKSKARKDIIQTLRTSTKGGAIFKGTSDHKSVAFYIRHIPWFNGTNRGFEKQAADFNRYIKIDLREPTEAERSKGQKFPSDEKLRDLGHKLIAIGIVYWKAMLAMEAALSRVVITGVPVLHRLIECYSIPVAVHAAVMGLGVEDDPGITDEDGKMLGGAKTMLSEILENRIEDVAREPHADEVQMVQFILTQTVRVGQFEIPLLYLATNSVPPAVVGGEETGKDIAARHGVKRVGGDWWFCEQLIERQEWWKRSDFNGIGIPEALKRLISLPKDEKCCRRQQRFLKGHNPIQATCVPRADMMRFISEVENELRLAVPEADDPIWG